MKMISPTNREVDIGQTLAADEYIGMVRREVMDGFMRDRAIEKVRWYVGFNVCRGSRGERQRSSCACLDFSLPMVPAHICKKKLKHAKTIPTLALSLRCFIL